MVNITSLTPQENDLLNNLLDKYGAKAFLEACYKLLDMENQERGGHGARSNPGDLDTARKSCSR